MRASFPRTTREEPIRWRDGGFQYRCGMCDQWWFLTREFWKPYNGMKRCAACWREYHRIHEANRNQDEATRLVKNYKDRLRYAENRPQRLAANRAWKAANRERIREYNRSYRERNKERLAAENKAYYDDARDVILMKKRQAYAEGKAA